VFNNLLLTKSVVSQNKHTFFCN